MAFIQVAPADDARWTELRSDPSFRYAQTLLLARDGREVVALPDIALEDLAEKGIRFTVIAEEELPRVLSPGSLEYYERLREAQPEHLYFDARLPPPHHVELSFATPSHLVPAARELLERRGAGEIQVREDAITMTIAGDGTVDEAELVQISCLAERPKALALREELMEAGLAGFSRETAIFISRDPDSLE